MTERNAIPLCRQPRSKSYAGKRPSQLKNTNTDLASITAVHMESPRTRHQIGRTRKMKKESRAGSTPGTTRGCAARCAASPTSTPTW
jgi:hypothetical protein